MTISSAEQLLATLELPVGDLHAHPSSAKCFPDGGQYRVEIPSCEGTDALAAVMDEASRQGVAIHRISSGSGVMLASDSELKYMAEAGSDAGVEICLFVGPRAPWEGVAAPLAADGGQIGWRHTGMDQLLYALRDVERAVAAGLRSILVADEGLIYAVARGRELGYFPDDLVIKGSAALGIGNAASLKVLAGLGLDTMNVPSDTSLAKLAAARAATALTLDLYIESPDALGGFLRYHEIAEIVRVAAPIHVKFGLRNAPGLYPSGGHLASVVVSSARERVRRAALGLAHLARSPHVYRASPVDPSRPGVPRL